MLGTFSALCKAYATQLPVVALPDRWGSGGGSATAVLAGRSVAPPATLVRWRLARLLHLSAGVVRIAERADGRRFCFARRGRPAGASRWSCTCRHAASRVSRTACTGSIRFATRS
jgi:hypothetical protein